jgi:peptidoglycan/LPS O-acetylase OafA/YrhL
MVRIKALDGIRGIAIFLVLLWHYIVCQTESDNGSILYYFTRSLSLTWSGVDLFFVLSGFLIVGILLDAKGSESYFKTFYIRRACRIIPLYFLMLCLFIIIPHITPTSNRWLFAEPLPLMSYFTFTQNYFMHNSGFGPNWLGVTWSLAVEEQFYLLIPILVWRLTRRQLSFLFVCMICMAPIFRLIFGNLGAYVFPFARADSILMGGLLALAMRNPSIRANLTENYKYIVGAFFIFLIGTAVLALKRYNTGDVFSHLWLGGFYSLLIASFIFRTVKAFNIVVSNRFFAWLGLRSYGIYLFHQPVSSIVHNYLNGNESPKFSNLSEFCATLIALAIVFIVAEVSYRYFESLFISYSRKYSYKKPNKGILINIKPIAMN